MTKRTSRKKSYENDEKDFNLASEVKVDLGGQRSLLEKCVQFNEKHFRKGLMKISRLVFELAL